jgi:hypothetical protein
MKRYKFTGEAPTVGRDFEQTITDIKDAVGDLHIRKSRVGTKGVKAHYDNTKVHLLLLVMSCIIIGNDRISLIVREKGVVSMAHSRNSC